MQYLRAFVIGSSFLVFAMYFLAVLSVPRSKRRYSYESYTFVGPLALGLTNTLALWVSNRLGLSRRVRYLGMSIVAPLAVLSFVYLSKAYRFNWDEWKHYIVILFVLYFFVCNVVLYQLDKNV
jgi:peptidoglycan/LPS O-acetylase OafA/YrhL